jgi:hypothetical protein
MEKFLICIGIAVVSGLISALIEKSDKIHWHIDRHGDPIMAGVTGGVAALFASLLFITFIAKFL